MKNSLFKLFRIYLLISVACHADWIDISPHEIKRVSFQTGLMPFAVDDKKIVVGDDSGVVISYDNGATWKRDTSELNKYRVCAVAIKNNIMLAGTCFRSNRDPISGRPTGVVDPPGGLFMSSDDGHIWEPINDMLDSTISPEQIAFGAILVIDDKIIASGNGTFLSNDDGETWIKKKSFSKLINGAGFGVESYIKSGPDIFLVSEEYGKLYKTSDDFETMTRVNLEGIELAKCGNRLILGGRDGSIMISTDNWSTFSTFMEPFDVPIPISYVPNMPVAVSGSNVFVKKNGSGSIWISPDSGYTWNRQIDPGPRGESFVQSLSTNSTQIYALSANSVWKRPLSELTGPLPVRKDVSNNTGFLLKAPSIIHRNSRFEIFVPKRCFVNLAIYDLKGNAIKTLNKSILEPGKKEIVIDGKGMSTGLYFVRCQTNLGTESIRIIFQ